MTKEVNIYVQVSVRTNVSFIIELNVEWLGVKVYVYMFNIMWKCETVFQNVCIILQSHEQCSWVPVAP